MRVLLVDDEPLVRAQQRDVLTPCADLTIVGEAADGPAAVEAIDALRPDLVLLDVQMPGCDGFEVLEQFAPEDRPVVVFVTAWQDYALRAFDAEAIDYLLKPFDDQRLLAAVERARTWLVAREGDEDRVPGLLASVAAGRRRQRFVVRHAGRVRVVPAAEVTWIEARGNYVHLHHPDGPFLMRETLQHLDGCLDPAAFVRTHRSAIVALDQVVELVRLPSGALELLLRCGARAPLGRSFRAAFERRWRA